MSRVIDNDEIGHLLTRRFAPTHMRARIAGHSHASCFSCTYINEHPPRHYCGARKNDPNPEQATTTATLCRMYTPK